MAKAEIHIDAAYLFQYAAECIRYYERTAAQPCCNDCGDVLRCGYAPKAGQAVRINCPLWVEAKEC